MSKTYPVRPSATGRLEIIFGPMFSGKTTEMFRRIKRYTAAGRHCGIVKYMHDTRYSEDHASSHDRQLMLAVSTKALADVDPKLSEWDVIGVDEGQFYEDLVPWCTKAVAAGKIVVVSALDGTFQRQPFGNVLQLVPLADSVVKLCAVCSLCGADAPFSRRITHETEVEVIGGADKYVAVCRSCFDEPIEMDNGQGSPTKLAHYEACLERLDRLQLDHSLVSTTS